MWLTKRGNMDATNDLILTTAVRYDWPLLQTYAKSLVQSGFRGEKVILVQDVSFAARQGLLDLGFTLVDFSITNVWNPQLTRYTPAVNFLKDKDFRYVIWTDMKDVIFQADPSLWLEKHLSPSRL